MADKWEAKAKAREAKARKRQGKDMVVRGRSLKSVIVPAIVKRGKKRS